MCRSTAGKRVFLKGGRQREAAASQRALFENCDAFFLVATTSEFTGHIRTSVQHRKVCKPRNQVVLQDQKYRSQAHRLSHECAHRNHQAAKLLSLINVFLMRMAAWPFPSPSSLGHDITPRVIPLRHLQPHQNIGHDAQNVWQTFGRKRVLDTWVFNNTICK